MLCLIRLVLVVVLLLGLSAPAVADDIFLIESGELTRLGTIERSRTVVGPVDIEPITLEFTDVGELLALLQDGAIHRIDPETAVTEEVVAARGDGEGRYVELTRAAPGWLYLLFENPDRSRDLKLLELETGREQNLGTLRSGENRPVAPEVPTTLLTLMTTADRQILGFDSDLIFPRLHTVGTASAGLFPLSNAQLTVERPFQSDIGSDGLLWVAYSFSIFFPPQQVLTAFDPETLDGADRAAYFFIGERMPFAIRRGDPATCRSDDTSICLQGERYRVSATWRDFDDRAGAGRVVPGASDTTTLFSFFSPDNQELMVKVLDGCGFNDRVWVFLSGTTNVEFSLRVLDTVTGEERIYDNELGDVASTVLDTQAFATCP
ncbi:MAG: hypothetical protein AAGM22_09590 [Acidobacteriota bacterium]